MATTRTGNILWICAEKSALGLGTFAINPTRNMSRTIEATIKHTGATSGKKSDSATSQTMKAIRIHNYGGPEVLQYEDAPRPKPQAGEVLIRVHAAGVNPIDWKVREGHMKDFWPHKFPLILGWDLSGVVEKLGRGVSRFKKGDEVYSLPDPTRNGAYADYIVVRESELALKPNSLHHIRAAAVPLAALTAWQSLFDTAQLQPGQRVLIHAGSGGVGHFAVQLAKWKGAYVFATASTKNQDLLRELGVDEPIDYTQQRFENVVRDIDIVLDTLGGETQERSWSVLKKGGVLVSLVQPPSEEKAERTRRPGCDHWRATERRAARRDREDHRLGPARACDRSHPAAFRSAPRARAQ